MVGRTGQGILYGVALGGHILFSARTLLWDLSILVQRGQTLQSPFPDLPEVLEEEKRLEKIVGPSQEVPSGPALVSPSGLGPQGPRKLALFF